MINRKHKWTPENDSDSNHLSEQIKRFRISVTPGELRLQKDLKDLIGNQEFILEHSSEPSVVLISFCDSCIFLPNKFKVKVPRFYPHDRPKVDCLDIGFVNNNINLTGNVVHPIIAEDWNATKTLADVIYTLKLIRQLFSKMNIPANTAPSSSGVVAMEEQFSDEI